jgi:hypothetical protein
LSFIEVGSEDDTGKLGDGRLDELEALTAIWLDGRMFSEGEPGAGGGGGGIWWEDARRDEGEAGKRGDGGTEFKSGMVVP